MGNITDNMCDIEGDFAQLKNELRLEEMWRMKIADMQMQQQIDAKKAIDEAMMALHNSTIQLAKMSSGCI